MAAYDGSVESRNGLFAAITMAERFHASLTIVSVAESPHVGLGTTAAILMTADYLDGARKRADRVLAQALAQVPSDLPVEGRAVVGSPAEVILRFSGECDLLVMGSRSNGPLWRTALGSVSSDVAGGAQCPLLVIPRGAGADPLGLVNAAVEHSV